ncbi:hypothetical protein AGMMS50225_11480 [Betaproteobacteria bacterium]|nr:hypothetical protein AGMMS50225_11480 [Betaproteobacteria bacterium]
MLLIVLHQLSQPGMYIVQNKVFDIERSMLMFHTLKLGDPVLTSKKHAGAEPLSFSPSFFVESMDLARQALPNFRTPLDQPYPRTRKLAVFTHVHNEDIYLKIFVDHYRKLTDPENIFIIDHESSWRSPYLTDAGGAQVIRIPRGAFDDRQIVRYCAWFQRFLLMEYEFVIHVDCDELLLHRHGTEALVALLEATPEPTVFQCKHMIEVIQDIDHEAALDPVIPVSMQRNWGYDSGIGKPVLASAPATWMAGFHHSLDDHCLRREEDLWLIHLHAASYEESVRKNQHMIHRVAAMKFLDGAPDERYLPDPDKVARDYRANLQKNATPMPEWMKGMF